MVTITRPFRRCIIGVQSQPWGAAAREVLEIIDRSEAELARRIDIKPPVLFRYLRNQRQPGESRVRRINGALATLASSPNIADYLNAVATRDGLLAPDDRFEEDLVDQLALASRYMRPGFSDFFSNQLLKLHPEVKQALINDLITSFRRRYIRHVAGNPLEDPLESFLSIADDYGILVHDWLRPDDEIAERKDERRFAILVDAALSSTNLGVADRMACERQIMTAFHSFNSKQLKRLIRESQP